MPHHTSLIATIVAGLGLAFVFGALAQRLRLPPLVGYLVAGVVIGPFTPGYVADQELAPQLAEIGVILLMFGVGLHFSLTDLLAVRAIAVPGAIGQIAVVTALGAGLAHLLGWPLGTGLVFGLALSVASTVVVLRALQERRLSTRSGAASRWAGSSWKTSRWSWPSCSFRRSPACLGGGRRSTERAAATEALAADGLRRLHRSGQRVGSRSP
jgi:predicted Kef-type K+ transport protein